MACLSPPAPGPPADMLDPHEITAELADPAVVSSGHTLQHGLLLRNRTGRELQIAPNGHVTATVVDPHTGEVVGGFAGFQNLPLIIFRVAPGQTVRVPLLIGTASSTPRLGNTIPPEDQESRLRSPSARTPPLGTQAHPDPAPHHHGPNYRRAELYYRARRGRDGEQVLGQR